MREQDLHFKSEDGLELFAHQWGENDAPQTVLCLHGLTRNHKDFAPMVEAMGGDRRYIAWDTRGRGRSAWDGNVENYRVDVYARDVLSLIEAFELDRFALIGTSMGGLISMLLMSMIADKITGVVLNDIGPKLDQAGIDRIAGYVGQTENFASFEDAATALHNVHQVAHPAFDRSDWIGFAKRTFVEADQGVAPAYDPGVAQSLASVEVDPEAEKTAWALFEHLNNHPLLIVRGEYSDLLSAETVDKMRRIHGAARDVVAAQVGHAPMLNEDGVWQAIDAFLTSLNQDGAGS